MGAVREIKSVSEAVIGSSGLVIVDFWAPRCPPCVMVGRVLEELAEGKSNVKVFKLNVDAAPEEAEQYSVVSVPTLVFFRDGVEKQRLSGLIPRSLLMETISELSE